VVVGDRTAGRFSDGKQGSLVWPEAVFMLLQPKSRSKPDDRAFVVAGKRVTTAERRNAGKVKRETKILGTTIGGSARWS
jgi:hypothetical protein